jgi:predicted nucleic acid-binding protein
MAAYYLDTSALVKRYFAEVGTGWMLALTDPAAGHLLFTGRLTGPEVLAAVWRKRRAGEVAVADAVRAEALFLADWQGQYQIVEIDPPIADRAMRLIGGQTLFAYDAVHLATALTVNEALLHNQQPPLTIVAADGRLFRAARAMHGHVANPEAQP